MRKSVLLSLVLNLSLLSLAACTDGGDKDGDGATDSGGDGGGADGAADGGTADGGGDGGVIDEDGDGFAADVDCDDTNAAINPDADEVCDGVDNDCNGDIDADDAGITDAGTYYTDADGDGVGADGSEVTTCAAEGLSAVGGDCDDANPAISPEADEICDDVDNDCDLLIDEDDDSLVSSTMAYVDADLDGFGDDAVVSPVCVLAEGYADVGGDCNDADDFVFPGAPERCDDVDADCDGDLDDPDSLGKFTFYADADLDGYGDVASTVEGCVVPAGYVENADDCNDGDGAISPAATDVCDDGIDNNCNTLVDCMDTDCAGDAICPFSCVDEYVSGEMASIASGTTVSGTPSEYSSTCGGSSGADHAVYWMAPTDGCYTISTDGSAFDTILAVYSDCSGTEVDCDDDGGVSTQSLLELSIEAGTELALVVDGYSSSSYGAWVLNISSNGFAACEEIDCADGLDDDGDGAIDCDDSACADEPYCYESDCADGIDNDGDGLFDCDDDECSAEPYCYESDCSDGIDNDSDGLLDCADDDCSGDSYCAVVCLDDDLAAGLGEPLTTGSTAGGTNSYDNSCGSSGGYDQQFAWEAPYGGCFTFDLSGSSFDTVLAVYDSCVGEELDCDDDGGAGTTSMVSGVALEAGDSVMLNVDGYSASDSGAFELSIMDGSIVSDATFGPVGSVTATFNSTLHGNENDISACSGSGYDYIYEFVPALTGTHTVSTAGSGFDTVLSVYSDDLCAAEIDCNDDFGAGSTSELVVEMVARQTYYVVVSGYSTSSSGSLNLEISELDVTCADEIVATPAAGVVGTGNTTGMVSDYPSTTGCGSSSSSGEDVSYEWVSPETGCWTFDTFGSAFDTVLRVWSGCGGGLIACDDDTYDGVSSYTRSEVSDVSLRAGDEALLIVDGYSSGSRGAYVLNASMTLPGQTCAGAEASCADGVDNDGNGATDCADTACAGLDGCP